MWQWFASSNAASCKRISPDELEVIGELESNQSVSRMKIPWKSLFSKLPGIVKLIKNIEKEVWAIYINHFAVNWAFYVLLTWLPTYMNQEYKFDLKNSGLISFLPFLRYLIEILVII